MRIPKRGERFAEIGAGGRILIARVITVVRDGKSDLVVWRFTGCAPGVDSALDFMARFGETPMSETKQ